MNLFDGATSLDGNGRSKPTLVATDCQKCVASVKEQFGAVFCHDPSVLVGARPLAWQRGQCRYRSKRISGSHGSVCFSAMLAAYR